MRIITSYMCPLCRSWKFCFWYFGKLLSYFQLTISNIKTFCRRQLLKIPHMKLNLNPLSANFTKNGQTHSNSSSANCRQIVWMCLTILWNWILKGQRKLMNFVIFKKDIVSTIISVRVWKRSQSANLQTI